MSVTYAVSKVATTFQVSYRAVGPVLGNYTYNTRRGFLQFDLAAEGISPGSIESAELQLVCASVIGGGETFILRSAIDPSGWSTTLDASSADYQSTISVLEGSLAISTTGTKIWSVAPSSINTAGVTYFRLQVSDEAAVAPASKGATFASQNHGTAANRPILRLTLFTGQVIIVNII